MLKQSFIYSIWLYARTAILAISTLYLAKVSSISDYGSYISALAIIGFFIPFVHGGMSYVYLDSNNLVMSSKAQCEKAWKFCLFASAIIAAIVAYVILEFFTENNLSFLTIFLLAVSEISLAGVYEIESRKEQHIGNPNKMGFWQVTPHALRLIFFIIVSKYFENHSFIESWILSSFLTCALCLLFARKTQEEAASLKILREFIKKSVYFGVGGSSLKIMYEIDKPILASISGHSTTAQLSIAQRIIDIASIPINSLISISLPRMLSENSPDKKLRILKFAIMTGLVVSVTSLAVVLVASPHITSFLGPEYSESQTLLAYLAWTPGASLFRGMLGNWLATSGYSNLYAKYNLSGAVIRSITCIPLIILLGTVGAIVGLALSELFIIFIMLNKLIWTIKSNDSSPEKSA